MPYIHNGEGLIIYDNCSAHMSGFSGWFMRQQPYFKQTIAPYTPEFNPIERFFRTIKSRFRDNTLHSNKVGLMAYLCKKFMTLEPDIFKSIF